MKVSEDGMSVRLIVTNLRRYYIHTISLMGIRDKADAYSLVHPIGYYTLNNIPTGTKLSMNGVSTKNTAKAPAAKTSTAMKSTYTYEEVRPLLVKYTCVACHNPDKKQVGPGFIDISRRNYTVDKIIQLITNPQPQNWPTYSTPMPPMPQVPAADAKKIAIWINSLQTKK